MQVPVTSIDDQITLVALAVDPTSKLPVSFAGPTPAGFSADDLKPLNDLATLLNTAPQIIFPPPPMPVPNQRSIAINKAKEDGNALFRKGDYVQAIIYYTLSAEIAADRPLIESNAYARDELAVTLCNRSAAYALAGEWINALVDADAVIALKRPWTKGHFRRGKAFLGMNRLAEAREAFLLGLQFDPTNQVCSGAREGM